MSVFPLPCLICNTQLAEVNPGNPEVNQVYSGLSFTSSGSYGSNFDPMSSGVHLVVTLCDECLQEKRQQQLIAFEKTKTRTVVETLKFWESDDE